MKKSLAVGLITASACMTLLGTTNASAHVYWAEPNEFYFYNHDNELEKHVAKNLTFEFTGGDSYFNADVNRAKGNEENYRFRILDQNKQDVAIDDAWQGKNRAVFETKLTQPGTYVLEAIRTGTPMYYTKLTNGEYLPKSADQLTPEEQKEKAESVGYYQSTKSYVTLYQSTDTWNKALGHPLEIIPLSHPDKVYVGDTFKVKLVYDGKPVAHTKIKWLAENYRFQEPGEKPETVTTNADGVASFTFPDADRYLLVTEHQVPLEKNPKAEKLSYNASLMLQVEQPWVKSWEKSAPAH